MDGYILEAKAKRILAGLAFARTTLNASPNHAWRLDHARASRAAPGYGTRSPHADEPTNHLDLETLACSKIT
jgi:ATPase subunit of ABC transporter with duplicated ATPase domains